MLSSLRIRRRRQEVAPTRVLRQAEPRLSARAARALVDALA